SSVPSIANSIERQLDAMDDQAVAAAASSFKQLKVLFPNVSKTWLRAHASQGAEVIAERLLDDPRIGPPTRGAESNSEGEEEEQEARPAVPNPGLQRPRQFAQPRPRLVLDAIDEERREEEQQEREEEAAKENYADSPARKMIRVERRVGGPQLQPNNNFRPLQQQLRELQEEDSDDVDDEDEAVAAENDDDEDEEQFEMTPIVVGEKCSGGCNQKPRGARVFCEDGIGDQKKVHTLCARCLERRWQAGSLVRDRSLHPLPLFVFYTCPMRNCHHRLWVAGLRAATRHHAPAVYDALTLELRQLRQRQKRGRAADTDDEEEEEQPMQPPPLEEKVNAQSGVGQQQQEQQGPHDEPEQPLTPTQPHPPRRLSWTPARREGAAAAAAAGAVEEEEPAVSAEEEQDLRDMAAFVDQEKLQQLQGYFPATAVGWLVRHSDYGMEWLIDMVHNQNKADPKLKPRADGRGATTIVQSVMASRKKFECSVCFADYDEHLAIACVYLPKRRRTMMPGEVAPSAAQLASLEAEQRKGTHEEHKFCAECVSGHARAATEQNVILEAGVGIKCMEPSCKRALMRAHVDQVLDMQTRATLDPLFSNEALLAADCQDVEKCQRCPFAAVMIDRDEQPVFVCANRPACGHMHCRKCGRTWDQAHKNRTCEELDPEAMRKRVEEQLTAAAMYRCPRCKRGIVKIDGCNKISCPCGQLSCYVCKASIENYKHFKNGPADDQTKCPLWVDPTARIEQERLELLRQQIAGAADEGIRKQL
ncbi:hypothetical protein PENTCL1PPCAC_24082, partial [Pristionchus entomophagus]